MKTVKTFEQFVAESNGNKVAAMLSKLGSDVEHEIVADMMGQDEEVSSHILNAMKKLGCKAEECGVIGDYHTDDYNKVLKIAKASGVKYIEIEDDNGEAIVFNMNESNTNESYNLSENLSVSALDIKDGLFYVSINGQEYGYKPEGMGIQDVVDKFKSILKHNAGRALAWLKKNSELVKGSKKNEAEIFESLDFEK